MVVLHHVNSVLNNMSDGIDYIEDMLYGFADSYCYCCISYLSLSLHFVLSLSSLSLSFSPLFLGLSLRSLSTLKD